MVALVMLGRRADIVGRFANRGPTQIAAVVGTAAVLTLNAYLVAQTFHT